MEFLNKIRAVAVSLQSRDPLDLFKDLIWDTVLEALVAAVVGALPGWLSFVGPILLTGLTIFTDKAYAALKLVIDFENIRIKNEDLRREYSAASVRLRLIFMEQGIDSEAFKNARKEHKKALSAFVKFNVPPVPAAA